MSQAIATGDFYKDEVQRQWDRDACGSQYVKGIEPHTLEWYLDVERYRYEVYGPWMPRLMEFNQHRGKKLLEVGGGMGTDHAQFAKNGAITTDLDLSSGHLEHARRNFALRGLNGEFVHGDAEAMPFEDCTFDVVYSNGVIHHTPNTKKTIDEIYRVLKPGGKIIIMVYAENSIYYWKSLFYGRGIEAGRLTSSSMGDIMSETVEMTDHGSKPLVKVYTAKRLRSMFSSFENRRIYKRQLEPHDRPRLLGWIPCSVLERLIGWNLIIKAYKPR